MDTIPGGKPIPTGETHCWGDPWSCQADLGLHPPLGEGTEHRCVPKDAGTDHTAVGHRAGSRHGASLYHKGCRNQVCSPKVRSWEWTWSITASLKMQELTVQPWAVELRRGTEHRCIPKDAGMNHTAVGHKAGSRHGASLNRKGCRNQSCSPGTQSWKQPQSIAASQIMQEPTVQPQGAELGADTEHHCIPKDAGTDCVALDCGANRHRASVHPKGCRNQLCSSRHGASVHP